MKLRWTNALALALLALALACAGCATTGPEPATPPLDAKTEVRALFKLGHERMADGQYQAAADAFRAAGKSAQDEGQRQSALLWLARAQAAAGQDDPALRTLNDLNLTALAPAEQVRAQILHGDLERKAGQNDKAAGRLRALLFKPPAPLDGLQAKQALEDLCAALEKLGRHEEAAASYLRWGEQYGLTTPEYMTRLADLAGQVNSESVALLEQKAATPQMRAALTLGLARAQLREGLLDQAGQTIERLRLDPQANAFEAQQRDLAAALAQARLVDPRAVGVILPLSGPYAATASQVLAAIELGLGLFRADGHGPTLYIEDSKGDPRAAAQAVDTLAVQRRVMAIIGPMRAATSLAAARQAAQHGAPLITLSRLEGVSQAAPCVFQNFFTPQEQVDVVLDEVMGKRHKRLIAILAPKSPYGQGFAELMEKSVIQRDGSVVRKIFYDPNLPDFSAQIKQLVALPPGNYRPGDPDSPAPVIDFEALFIPDGGARLGMIAPQLAYHDVIGIDLLGSSLWHDPVVLKTAGRYLEGCIFPVPFNPDDPRPMVREFVEAFSRNMGRKPNLLDAHGYDAAIMLRRIMDGPEAPRTRAEFCRQLSQASAVEGVCGQISVGPDGRFVKALELFTISRERFAPLAQAGQSVGPPSYPKPSADEEPEPVDGQLDSQPRPQLQPYTPPGEPEDQPPIRELPLTPAPAGTIAR